MPTIRTVSPSSLLQRIDRAIPARPLAYVLCLITAMCWAGTIVVGRAATPEVPPMALNFWRWLIAFAVMAPFTGAGLIAKRRVLIEHWPILNVLGILNMTAFGGLFFLGIEHTQAINGSILLSTMTINIVLVSWLFVGVRISRVQSAGVVIGFVGIMTMIVRGDLQRLLDLSIDIGDPLIWAGTLAFAFYSAYVPRAPKALSPGELMTVLCLVGTITCFPLIMIEAVVFERPTLWNLDAILAIGFLGLFPSALAQTIWVAGINRIGATTAGYFIYTVPVFGTAMAIGFLGETLRWYHLAGITLIFIGVYAATARAGKTDQTA